MTHVLMVVTSAPYRTWDFSGTFPTKAWVERVVVIGYPIEPYRILISLGWPMHNIIHTIIHRPFVLYLRAPELLALYLRAPELLALYLRDCI